MNLGRILGIQNWSKKAKVANLISWGAFVGMGIYVAMLSNFTSYLSDDSKACINCHVMNPQYATWQRSSHGTVTNCNDCHVPHDTTFNKYYFKAKDGSRHSALFIFRKERQTITATEESKHVIQQNCIRCHENVLEATLIRSGHDKTRMCTDCHREVPHGREHSLSSSPNAAIPLLAPATPKWIQKATNQNPKP